LTDESLVPLPLLGLGDGPLVLTLVLPLVLDWTLDVIDITESSSLLLLGGGASLSSEDFFDLDGKDLPDLDLLDLLADLDLGDDLDLRDLPDLLLVDLADLDEEIFTTLGGFGETLVDPVSEVLCSEECAEEGSSSVAVTTGGSSGGSSFSELYVGK